MKPYSIMSMMADRSSDRLINEGQLSWTLICVRFDVMTLLNNIIYSFNQLYIGIPTWPEVVATRGRVWLIIFFYPCTLSI